MVVGIGVSCNDFILTQQNTENPVNDLSSGVERGFNASLVSTSVFSTVVVIMAL